MKIPSLLKPPIATKLSISSGSFGVKQPKKKQEKET